jgi:ParB-like chromosome segregation protein Spo0J
VERDVRALPPIERVRIADLSVTEGNPNVMDPKDLKRLTESIRQEGFLQPILVRRTGAGKLEVIDGCHRLRAVEKLGYEEVLAVVTESDEETATALRIGMNKLRGRLDLARVASDAADLFDMGWSLESLALTGFSPEELDDLISSTKVDDADIPKLDDLGEPAGVSRSWSLELSFRTKRDRDRARRKLTVLGEGDPTAGLLDLLEGQP